MSKISPTYVVMPGDTLQSIAQKIYGDFRQVNYLIAANNIQNPDLLRPGDVLTIPLLSSYASVQPTIPSNFASSPRAAADTLIDQVESERVTMPSINTLAPAPANVPTPNVTYEAGSGADLGTVTASATKLMPWWMTAVLIAAGAYILFGDRK